MYGSLLPIKSKRIMKHQYRLRICSLNRNIRMKSSASIEGSATKTYKNQPAQSKGNTIRREGRRMEISKKLAEAMNDQINYELYSGYIYLSMAAWFEEKNLDGMAQWMKSQANEEYAHALKFWDHIVERGGRVLLTTIEAPKTKWTSPLEAWEDAYQHERKVTERIFKIGKIAEKEGDRSATPLLQWFYNEQVEEEEQTMNVRDKLKMIGDATGALLMLDAKLGQREG